MAFCTKCGKELRDGDKFCFYCGEPVRGGNEGEEGKRSEPVKQEEEVKRTEPTGFSTEEIKTDSRHGNKKPGNARLAVGAAAVLALIFAVFFFLRGEKSQEEKPEDDTKYVSYVNDTVCFSFDYPEGYTVTEPDSNNVLITEDSEADFQISAEYAVSTAGNSFIYSAKDFAEQIEDDGDVLTAWTGAKEIELTDTKKGELGGRERYQYDFTFEMEGNPNAGRLILIEGDGEFGCYSLMSAINENAEDAALYKKQRDAAEQTFKVTGAHQAEGYRIYSYDSPDVSFAVRDEVLESTEQSGDRIVVYPVKGEYSRASIWMDEDDGESVGRDIKALIQKNIEFDLSHYDGAQLISQPKELNIGRYPVLGADMGYYEKGERYTCSEFVVSHDDGFWEIKLKSTDANFDAVSGAMSDVLSSLRFGGGEADGGDSREPEVGGLTSGDTKGEDTKSRDTKSEDTENGENAIDAASEVIREIKSQAGFVDNSSWKPLAAADDFNGDNVQELLAVYEVKDGAGINVMYDLWSLGKDGAAKIKSEVLFKEVGGNNGIVGIVKPGGVPYLAVYRYEPEGDLFNNYYTYFSWEKDKSALGDSGYYLENHGNYNQEDKGRYIMGDTAVEKEKFDAKYRELTTWEYRLDLLGGAGDGGVKTFDDF